MKYITLVICCLVLVSCGSSKRAAQQPTKQQQETVVTPIPEKPAAVEEATEEIPKEEMVKEVEETVIPTPEDSAPEIFFDHTSWNTLLQQYVSENGNVDYKGFKNNRIALNAYLRLLGETVPSDEWSREAQLAYWINAYNAFTVKLIIDNYPTKSIKDINKPWDYRFIKIGPKWYTLNDIEHKILRKMDEPRIHFAINCASVSCPKLLNEAFTETELESQLTEVSKGFLQDATRNEISEDQIRISKIFRWFGKDFKKDGSLIDFLNKYADIEISPKAKVSFKDYDWNLNE